MSNAIVVIQAAISRSAGRGDPVRSIVSGQLRFAILCLNGLSFVASGHRSLPQRWLMACCEQLYLHVVFIMTLPALAPLVTNNPSMDLENQLRGTHDAARSLVFAQRHSAAPWMNALPMLPLQPSLRHNATQQLAALDFPGTVFSLLSVGRQLVTFTQGQQRQLSPADAHLLVNYALSHNNTRTSDSLFTVCLPHFAARGTVQMGVAHVGTVRRCARASPPPSVQTLSASTQSWGASVGLTPSAGTPSEDGAAAHGSGWGGVEGEDTPPRSEASKEAAPTGPRNLPLLMKVADEMLATAAQRMNGPMEESSTAALGLQGGGSTQASASSGGESHTTASHGAQSPAPRPPLEEDAGDAGFDGLLLESDQEDIFLIAITTEILSSAFSLLRSARQRLRNSLEIGKSLEELPGSVRGGGVLPERIGVPGLLHFAYMWKPLQQSMESAYPEGACSGWHRRRLVSKYASMFERLTADTPTLRHVVDGSDASVMYAGLHSTNAILLATWQRSDTSGDSTANAGKGEKGGGLPPAGDLPRHMEALAKTLQGKHDFLFVTKPAQPRSR